MKERAILALTGIILASCAGGATMRAVDDDASGEEPVALAPAPEPDSDSTSLEGSRSDSTVWNPPDSNVSAPQAPAVSSAPAQGYAPYSAQGTAPSPDGDAQIRRIGQWSRTGIGEARRIVIRDANAWAEFWAELGVGDRPAIDFNQNLIVAVASGQRPSGGYEIAVQRVSRTNGELTIQVVETSPGPNCITTTSLTQPVDVIAVPRLGANSWSFVESKEVRTCR